MRLDKFLSGQTACSRSELNRLIRNGAVTVNGIVIRKPDTAIKPETDAVALQGKPVLYQQFHWFLLHKPTGVLTAARDPKQKTVMDLLRQDDRLPKLAPVGRLDLDTSGLLLITDDGQTAHRLLSPKHHAPKYYLAKLRDPFQPEYVQKFRDGILLREGASEEACKPAECAQIHTRLAVLELREGKYHQVRRMFAAAGNEVESLLRVQIGMLQLPPDLPAGTYLHIFNKDVESALKNSDISQVCAFCDAYYSSYWINSGK
ncbi:MAG TPA: rRNA pseudouridine synthase [Ruminococcus sp.]|nr:rRNA pseudouridine synthase [Ruminococcus sp.]